MLSGDRFYTLVYQYMGNLYRSQLDHKAVIDLLHLKSQKRDSKRLMDFLEGAH